MARCKSWRFTASKVDQTKWLPVGRNHKVWRPCREKVPAGSKRCAACEKALILCPSTVIRKALVNEADQNRGVLFQLTTDSAEAISLEAKRRLTELDAPAAEAAPGTRPTTHNLWS